MRWLDVFSWIVLLGCCAAAGLLVPESPVRHIGEPTYDAVLSMPLILGALLWFRLGRHSLRAAWTLLAVFLATMPLVYVASWIGRSGGHGWLWIELAGLLLFASMATLGLFRWSWLLVAGLAGHGLLWDSWHYGRISYVPDWYALACLIVDIGFAVFATCWLQRLTTQTGPAPSVQRVFVPVAALLLAGGLDVGLLLHHQPQPESVIAELRRHARELLPSVRAPWVQEFLGAASTLPSIAPRLLYTDGQGHFYPASQAIGLPDEERQRLKRLPVDEETYYYGKYGTPLAYARPLDLLAQAGVDTIEGKRVLDFGYGQIGAPRLLASIGADVTGVDIDPERQAIYGFPGDQGEIHGPAGKTGHLRLLLGRYPADPAIREAVGQGYDVIVAKNVLKNGFLHPERPPQRESQRMHLGVEDAQFVQALAEILKPGGRMIIYNLYPAQSPPDQPYKTWADGRNPFPEAMWRTAGLRVLPPGLDRDDTAFARTMARILEWHLPDRRHPEEPPMDVERDLFASYTIIAK